MLAVPLQEKRKEKVPYPYSGTVSIHEKELKVIYAKRGTLKC